MYLWKLTSPWRLHYGAVAIGKVLLELEVRFPTMDVLDVLGVIYPQYWLQGDGEASFCKHLTVIKEFYGKPRSIVHNGVRIVAPPILDKYRLESEQPLLKWQWWQIPPR